MSRSLLFPDDGNGEFEKKYPRRLFFDVVVMTFQLSRKVAVASFPVKKSLETSCIARSFSRTSLPFNKSRLAKLSFSQTWGDLSMSAISYLSYLTSVVDVNTTSPVNSELKIATFPPRLRERKLS